LNFNIRTTPTEFSKLPKCPRHTQTKRAASFFPVALLLLLVRSSAPPTSPLDPTCPGAPCSTSQSRPRHASPARPLAQRFKELSPLLSGEGGRGSVPRAPPRRRPQALQDAAPRRPRPGGSAYLRRCFQPHAARATAGQCLERRGTHGRIISAPLPI
jgi:hypothetical protein